MNEVPMRDEPKTINRSQLESLYGPSTNCDVVDYNYRDTNLVKRLVTVVCPGVPDVDYFVTKDPHLPPLSIEHNAQ
jgi:hypothetical protein